jgi:hypothetical protein
MSTVAFTAFLPEVLPYVHDCPQFVAVNAIRNAAIEFCERSRFLQVDLDPVTVTGGIPNYEIDVPTDTTILEIMATWYDGRLLIPKSTDELNRLFIGSDWRTKEGMPAYVNRISTEEVFLVPVPAVTDSQVLTMRVAVAPSRDATTVDETLYQRYLETIAKGALSRLQGMAGQPYYDPSASQLNRIRFTHEFLKAKIDVNKGLMRASMAIEYQRFL